MNNTDKLLRAFIEASGYEIEECRENISSGGSGPMGSWQKVESLVVDYKVTKKEAQVCFDVDSPEWSCIVNYVLGAKYEIEIKENNFGDLQPMLDYFNRNS